MLACVIDVGDHLLMPNLAGQNVFIDVSSDPAEQVQGLNFYIQVADGGPEAAALGAIPPPGIDGPGIEFLDVLTGTIFDGNNVGAADLDGPGPDILPQWEGHTTATATGTVPANGLLGTLFLNTLGFNASTFDLFMSNTLNGPTNFAGTPATITDGTITVSTKPTAVPGTGYTVVEGGSLVLDGSASSDPEESFVFGGRTLNLDSIVTYHWDLDGDGIFGETGAAAARGDETGVAPTFSAADVDGELTVPIALKVYDTTGLVSDVATSSVTVTNANPVVEAGPNQSVNEGATVSLAPATFTDPGAADTHDAIIDWGDGWVTAGSVNQAAKTVSGDHVYADNGTYTVTVTASDDDDGSGSHTLTVTVSNVAPTLTVPGNQTLDKGTLLALANIGIFTDPGFDNDPPGTTFDTVETFTYTINWGDGTPADTGAATIDTVGGSGTATAGSFDGSHTYVEDGPCTVTVQVSDDDGGSDTETFTVTLTNVAPTLSNLAATNCDENGTTTFTGTINDPSPTDSFTLAVDWGDGSAVENFTYPAGTTTFSETHQYLDDDPTATSSDLYTISATVTDDSGSGTGSTTLTVSNVAPVASALNLSATTIHEGGTVTVTGSFTDVGTKDTHTVIIDWGGGETPSAAVVTQGAGGGTFTATHQYADNGIYSITATVTDDDNGSHTGAPATLTIVSEDLGSITCQQLTGLGLSGGDLWYSMTTSQAGFLTASATPLGAVMLTLYDESGNQLDPAATGTGTERVEHYADGQGIVYCVKLEGIGSNVDLALCNLVSVVDDTAIVSGTDEADNFECTVAPTDSACQINGIPYSLSDLGVCVVTYDACGGYDTVQFNGSMGNDWVRLWPDHGWFKGGGITVTTQNVEDVTANGGGGTDVAELCGSDQVDTFRAGPGSAEMFGLGYHIDANGFFYLHGYPGPSGVCQPGDVAELEGEPGSTDFTRVWPQQTRIHGDGFRTRAKGFPEVYVAGTDVSDIVTFYPDGGDHLETRADPFSGQMTCDTGQNVQAQGFANIVAYSKRGSGDRADLYDSPSHKDKFLAAPDFARLYGTLFDKRFNHRVKFFDQVAAHSSGGVNDVAVVRDGPGTDTVEAHTDRIKITYEPGNLVEAANFRWMHGRSTEGGNDTAQLYDRTHDGLVGEAVWFLGRPGDSRIYSPGYGFFTRVRGFPQTSANATGNDDVAVLHDSPGAADTFLAYADLGRMNYFDGTFAQAVNFRYLHAFSRGSGLDTATLYDQTFAGIPYATRFYGRQDSCILRTGYNNGLVRVWEFEEVEARASGNDDRADLYDSPGDDVFDALADRGTITYGAGNTVSAIDFWHAYGSADDHDDDDTANLHAGTRWQAIGDWETINNIP